MKNVLLTMLLFLMVAGLLASSAPAAAQEEADPAEVVQAIYDAIAAGDVDRAMSMVADDVVLLIIPLGEGFDGSFVGKEEVRAWWEGIAQENSRVEFSHITVSGNAATWQARFWDDYFEGLGIAPAEFEGGNVVEDGLLKSIVWVFTPEFLARMERAETLAANRTLAERFIEEVWNQNDPDLADEFVSEDFVSYDYPQGGREELKAAVAGFQEELPDGYFSIDETIVTADKIIMRGSAVAQRPPEGQEPERLDYWINVLSVKDGKITDRWLGFVDVEGEAQAEMPAQPPTSIADLAGVWWRPKAGYPEPGKFVWQLNPDGTDLMLQEDTVAGQVVRRQSDEFPPAQWWFEGLELQVVTPGIEPDELDLAACNGTGRYQVQLAEGGGITFEVIEDTCGYRTAFMVGEVWQREQ